MKKVLSILSAIILVFSAVPMSGIADLTKNIDFSFLTVKSDAASESDLTFTLNDDGNSYSVKAKSTSISGELVIPSTYNGKPITHIGNSAFWCCSRLTSVTIGNGVTDINASAFGGCVSLTSITIPDSVTSIDDSAFFGCSSLTSITIPDGVTSIESYAFYGCNSLTSITIPDSVTSIGEEAFCDCDNLISITLPCIYGNYFGYIFGDYNAYRSSDFDESSFVPATLKIVAFSNKCTEIPCRAFYNCSSLTSITIPDSVTSIGSSAFFGCGGLTSVTIPDSVTSIGSSAFFGCSSLTSITIPYSVTYIGDNAFENTAYYNNAENWENNVLYIGNHLIKANPSISGAYKIKDNTKTIANSAFCNCGSLTSITIPDSVTSISYATFYGCGSLTSITIPDSVTTIGRSAFCDCNNLSEIKIGKGLIEFSSGDYSYSFPKSATLFVNCQCPVLTSLNAEYTVEVTHNFDEWQTVAEATCFSIGLKHRICKDCDFEEEKYIKPVAHKYSDEWTVDKEATCTNAGLKSHHCKWCTDKKDVTVIEAQNHNIQLLVAEIPATCTTTGRKAIYICKNGCGYTEGGEIIPATGHNYVNGFCSDCGTWENKDNAPKLVSVKNTSTGVTVTWESFNGAEFYVVYRKISGTSKWSRMGIAEDGKLTFTDTKVVSGKTYDYTVRAYSEDMSSKYDKTGIKILYIAQPKLSKVTSAKSGVTIQWGKVTGASGYMVYRKIGSGKWVKLTTIKENTKVSYLDKSAKKGTTYTYTVKAYNGKTYSAYNATGLKIKDKY